MASIRIASIQKKKRWIFFFGTTGTRITGSTDHSFCLLQNGVTFSVCLIFNLQIFGNLRHLQTTTTTLTSFHGVECQPRLQGCHLKKNCISRLQNGQQKKWAPKQSPPKNTNQKLYVLDRKKIQLFSTNQMLEFTGKPGLHNPCWRS